MPLRNPRRARRNYNRVGNQDDENDNVTESNALDEPLSPSSSFEEQDDGNTTSSPIETSDEGPTGTTIISLSSAPPAPPIYHEINVVVMDSAQSKFNIKCDKNWKVREFKEASASSTKVAPQSQRLIHMGKLLSDESTLEECGIKESDKIIHLFPKPNVVITNEGGTGQGNDETNDEDNGEGTTEGGAHIPQIILDAEEASRRSQILILSSQEIFEAQHRVKIFSFLLMIISSMELLTLMTLFVGMSAEDPTGYGGGGSGPPPGNPTDVPPSGSNNSMGGQMRTWQNSDYFDAVISAFGFYVSLLGIKATTENTLQLAKRYFLCLCVAGVSFNAYYFYMNAQAEKKHAQERNQQIATSDLYTTAFVGILLPMTVWLLCIIRAYQFQHLIREAELEAEERTRGLEGEGTTNDSGSGEGEMTRTLPYGSDDLELTVEQGVST